MTDNLSIRSIEKEIGENDEDIYLRALIEEKIKLHEIYRIT